MCISHWTNWASWNFTLGFEWNAKLPKLEIIKINLIANLVKVFKKWWNHICLKFQTIHKQRCKIPWILLHINNSPWVQMFSPNPIKIKISILMFTIACPCQERVGAHPWRCIFLQPIYWFKKIALVNNLVLIFTNHYHISTHVWFIHDIILISDLQKCSGNSEEEMVIAFPKQ